MPLATRFGTALVFAVLAATPAAAQFGAPEAPCPLGTAEARLRGADVEAALFTNGNLFFGPDAYNGDGYLVPLDHPNGRVSPIFAADLWIGGTVGGEVRTAAARYTNFQLRPGRTGPGMTPPDSSACAAADRIWFLSQDGPRAGRHLRRRRARVARRPRRAGHRRRRHRGQLRPRRRRPPRHPRRRDGVLVHDRHGGRAARGRAPPRRGRDRRGVRDLRAPDGDVLPLHDHEPQRDTH